jgi:galactose oxidase-like protein/Kelch motif protein
MLAAIALFAGPEAAPAAITFVQAVGATNDAAGSSIAATFTTNNTAGNLLVVAVSWGDRTAPSIKATDTLGNTYVVATNDFDPGNRQGLAILYAPNIRAGANAVTVNLGAANGYRRIIVSEYSGIATTSPLDVVAKNRAAGTAASNGVTSTAATTTVSGDLIFGVAVDDSGLFGTITAGTGFTRRAVVNNMDMATEDRIQATAGSVAATFTFSRADSYLAQMAAFKPGSGGGGGGGSPSVSSLACAPASLMSGASTTCTVTLNQAAPAGGSTVTVASNNTAALPVPASVTVPATTNSTTFAATAGSVATSQTVTVTATLGASTPTTVTVTPGPSVASLTCAPPSLTSGAATTCTITLTQAAPAGGSIVALSSNNITALPVPASATVPATTNSTTFTATAGSVATSQTVTVTATLGASATGAVTVTSSSSPGVSSLACTPASLTSGASTTCTVALTQAAPAGGSTVTLLSNDPTALPVPASVIVPADSTSATFTATAELVATAQTARVTATLGGTSTTTTVTVASSQAQLRGAWSGRFTWPIVAVHMVLLPTGKVLAWDLENNSVQVWNPAADTFTDVTNTAVNFNFFCAGQTALADGRVLIDGGHVTWDVGSRAANAFDPVTQTWSALQPMAFERWYPTVITLADGRVLAVAGHTTCKTCVASTPEVYDPVSNTWTPLPGAVSSIPTQYPHLFVLPDGRVVQVSSSEEVIPTAVLDVNAQTWTTVDPRPLDGGSAVMYAPGKVMKAGAAWDDGVGNPATTTYVLDMTQATPSWRQTSGMAFPRLTHNLTLLPDGTVLVTGGSSNPYLSDPASVVYDAELWSPTTETWTPMARMLTPRMYHSTALLLPDGRVLSAGGGRFGGTGPAVDQLSAEVYSPPYLFNGVRPTITSAPATIAYGSTFSVTTPDAAQVAAVSVVRLGSVTHTFDAGQRFLSLNYQQIAGGLSVTAPLNENLAPPGYYMLFILNTNGVPSIAPFVQIR